ncbi:hypothetical protein F862_gp082 [Vibrio phage vB_VpaS_MAR10]|uniref:Uncharacterized protein n=1 Tax=Vibrio phage vB_VpaS_MAR10 TaxID=1229755 RepID=K7R2K1_9CAUD|nr:hypothetical protein F862_gp082 [Vibrio phage vB_VpaS_MAR10]AFV81314.1 hypothetical protein MAR10_080 [Vibrio phage vB_VpaS_MAR10]
MLNFTVSKTNLIMFPWVRNTLVAEDTQPCISGVFNVKFVLNAESQSDSEEIVDHSFIDAYAGMIADLFRDTNIVWDKDEAGRTVAKSIHESYPRTRILTTPYNPTMENVAGMFYAIMHRVLCASNFTNSEDPDLCLVSVVLEDVTRGHSAECTQWAHEGRYMKNGAQFHWTESITDLSEFDVVSLFTEDVRIGVPVAGTTVDKYE